MDGTHNRSRRNNPHRRGRGGHNNRNRPRTRNGERGHRSSRREPRQVNSTVATQRVGNNGIRAPKLGNRRTSNGTDGDVAEQPIDERRNYSILENCSRSVKATLGKMYPHYKFNYKNSGFPHPHKCAAVARVIGNNICYGKAKELTRLEKGEIILDVGTSVRNSNKTLIHGCDHGQDVYTVAKFQKISYKYGHRNLTNLEIKQREAVMEHRPKRLARGRTEPKWTYCRHSAINCACMQTVGKQFSTAMFVHSIYYSTPEQVAAILLRTTTRKGFSIHHLFPEDSGRFYQCGENEFECSYTKRNSMVVMKVKGNDHVYKHSACEWLLNPEQKVKVTVETCSAPAEPDNDPNSSEEEIEVEDDDSYNFTFNPASVHGDSRDIPFDPSAPRDTRYSEPQVGARDYFLTWTTFPVDATGMTVGYEFTLLEATPDIDDEPPQPYTDDVMSDEDIQGKYDLMELEQRDFAGIRLSCCGQKLVTLETANKLYKIPKKYFYSAVRFLMGKTLDREGKTHRDLLVYIRSQSYTKHYDDHPEVTQASLILAIPTLATYVIELVLDKFDETRNFYRPRTFHKMDEYNRRLSFKYSSFKLIDVLVIGVVILTGLLLWLAGIHWIVFVITILVVICGFSFARLLYIYGLCFIPGVHTHTLGIVTVGSSFSVYIVLILIVLLYYWLRKRKKRDYRFFEAFLSEYRHMRQTLTGSGSVPPGAYLPSYETLIDAREFPTRENAGYEIKEVDLRDYSDLPGAWFVGPVFCCSAVAVHSTSQHNLKHAIVSRSILDIFDNPSEPYWINCTRLISLEKQIHERNGLPVPFTTNFRFAGKDFTFPEITWIYWLRRFPPVKRQAILDAKKKIDQGLVQYKHMAYGTFNKREKANVVNRKEYVPQKPRTIQGCSKYSKVVGGPWFLSYSYALKFAWNPSTYIWYCSGYTTEVFNSWITYWLGILGIVMAFGTDFSKYDLTQNKICIKMENAWYESLGFLKGKYSEIRKWVLRMKMHTVGYGKGIKYWVLGTRKSGDNDTSSGNSRNTGICVLSFLLLILFIPGKDFACAVLGDDNFTLLRKRKLLEFGIERFKRMFAEHCVRLGFKIKMILSEDIASCEFLSRRFYPTKNGYKVGKKPGRVLAKIGYFLAKAPRKAAEWLPLLKGSILSILPVCNHVPFLRIYCKIVLENLMGVKALIEEVYEHDKGQIHEPDCETFAAFEKVYGLTRAQEAIFARQLRSSILSYGLRCIVDSEYVQQMLDVDQEM